jgi:hypothetical protein
MPNFPQDFYQIAQDTARAHDGIPAATDDAMQKIGSLPNYGQFVAALVREAIRGLVEQARHADNVKAKREAGAYYQPTKVRLGASGAVEEVAAQSLYNYFIGGTMLGLLRGQDLSNVADSERKIIQGHRFNERLCERLRPMVPNNATVRDKVSERKLRTIFREIQQEIGGQASAAG